MRKTLRMRLRKVLPYNGYVVWLTPEQGGRTSGPPATPATDDYAATAFVPPRTVDCGQASFVLRVADRDAWLSPAAGAWLVDQDDARFQARVGSVLVVTEGRKAVAYFHVESVRSDRDTAPAPG